jgi:flagellar motor switch protein FliG
VADPRASQGLRAGEAAGEGARRAAAVLIGLGGEVAAQVFRQLDETTIRQLALGARELKRSPDLVGSALEGFIQGMESVGGEAAAGDGLLREIATRALGPEAAQRAFEGVQAPEPHDDAMGAVAQADTEALAMILAREQPQTVALVLGSLEQGRAAALLKSLPERLTPHVLRRLASLESVAPEVLQEVGQALQSELRQSDSGGASRRVDGKAAAVSLLRRQPPSRQTEVVNEIEKDDPELAGDLRAKLFTFEDLSSLSDRDIQTFIREIDTARLTTALKGASSAVSEKILKNMSSRAAEMLRDEIAASGPMRLSVVEEVQAELVKTAFALAEQGRITLVGPSDKMV